MTVWILILYLLVPGQDGGVSTLPFEQHIHASFDGCQRQREATIEAWKDRTDTRISLCKPFEVEE